MDSRFEIHDTNQITSKNSTQEQQNMSFSKPTETLTSTDLPSVVFANRRFGSDTSLMVARPGKLFWKFPLFWFTVPEGFYALVTRHGAIDEYKSSDGSKTPVWPAGVHMGPPWLKVSHLVTKQSMIFNTPVQGCKTKDNVTVEIDIALVLRVMGDSKRPGDDPWNVYKFVHGVTARGLERQLNDAQSEAVRTLARSMTHTEVFGLRSVSQTELTAFKRSIVASRDPALSPVTFVESEIVLDPVQEEKVPEDDEDEEDDRDLIGEHDELDPLEAGFNTEAGASVTQMMKTRLNRQFKPQGIEITDVIIQQITLPDEIQSQMSNKTMVISQNAEQRMQQRFDLLSLHQTEAIKTLQQKHKEMKEELTEDGKLKELKEKLALKEQNVNANRVLSQIRSEREAELSRLLASSDERVQKIRDKTKLASEEVKQKSEAEATKLEVTAAAEVIELRAKAQLEFTKLRAQADKALFHAEGVSAPLMRTLNDHTTELKKYDAQQKLASNDKLIITGTTGGEAANRLILTEAALKGARTSEIQSKNTSSVLSQLAVASGNAQVRLNMWDDQGAPALQ